MHAMTKKVITPVRKVYVVVGYAKVMFLPSETCIF